MAVTVKWPSLLKELAERYSEDSVRFGTSRDTIESELWVLIQAVLGGYMVHEIHNPEVRRDELPGLTTDKTAELMEQIRRGRWNPAGEDEKKIHAYFRQVARNTGRAFWRKWYRSRSGEMPEELGEVESKASAPDPEECAAGRELARRLYQWLCGFKPLHAEIFVMRAFYHMRSREIADHPRVQTSPTNVDTVWDRMRREFRKLLGESGGGPGSFPPGTFASFLILWESGGEEGPL